MVTCLGTVKNEKEKENEKKKKKHDTTNFSPGFV